MTVNHSPTTVPRMEGKRERAQHRHVDRLRCLTSIPRTPARHSGFARCTLARQQKNWCGVRGGGTMSAAASAKKVGAALTRSVQVSPALKQFLGVGECSRSESMKRVWDYIKDQKLQNPQNRKEIFCDEKLKPVLGGKDKVGFLEIAKHLSDHFPKALKVPKAPKVPKTPKAPKASPLDPSTPHT